MCVLENRLMKEGSGIFLFIDSLLLEVIGPGTKLSADFFLLSNAQILDVLSAFVATSIWMNFARNVKAFL